MTASATSKPATTSPPARGPLLRSAPAREAVTFLGLVYLMVVGIALALPHAGIAVVLSMVTPLLAVLVITFVRAPRGRRTALWRTLGLRRLGLRSWPIAFAVSALLVLLIPYGVAALLGSATLMPFNPAAAAWLNGSLNLGINLVLGTIMAMTEEIGWRGYLLPRTQALMSRRRAAVAVGFVHGLFHMPLVLLTTTYDSVGSRWVVGPVVVATLTAAGVFYAWLKDRSGSTWPVAFAHSSVNALLDGGGVVLIVSPVALAYTAGESGLVTLLAVVGSAVVLLIRGRTWAPTTTRV